MKKKIWYLVSIVIIILSTYNVNGDEADLVVENITTDEAIVVVEEKPYEMKYVENEVVADRFNYVQQNYQFKDFGYYFCRKINFLQDGGTYVTSFYMPGSNGVLSYYEKGKLIQKPFYEGYLPLGGKLILETDKYNYILGQAHSYKDLGNGTVDSFNNERSIRLSKVNGKWLVTYSYTMRKGSYGIMWGLGSSKELIDFDFGANELIWNSYDMDNNARVLQDGYYYKSPSSYTPSTSRSYWRIPSMYVASAFVRTGGSIASDMLGQALLFVGKDNINSDGFLPSLPRSEWLNTEYSIKGNFFDTRFNADMIETYIQAYKKFKHEEFRDTYLILADYYSQHIENQHLLVSDEEKIGWLVEDYNHSDVDIETHCSLNHQLEAIHIFLLLYEDEGEQQYFDYAMLMLDGIKVTKDKWIMSNSNLEYAYLPNGRMGFVDYPYLTYNDLYKVQLDLERITGERDSDLELLMDTKRIWMDKKGITGYKK